MIKRKYPDEIRQFAVEQGLARHTPMQIVRQVRQKWPEHNQITTGAIKGMQAAHKKSVSKGCADTFTAPTITLGGPRWSVENIDNVEVA